jgi:hypothetical protein
MKMKDFSYAQKRKDRPWYIVRTKNYETYLWGLPFLPITVASKAIKDWAYRRRVWDDDKAKKALDHILPHKLEWVEEDKAYYYCMDWSFYNLHKYAPFYLKKWAAKFDYGLHHYIAFDYEKEGYIKTVEKDDYGDTWIKFEKRA